MTSSPQYYYWKDLKCAYSVHASGNSVTPKSAIALIHPIGVGLSKAFWQPFIDAWLAQNPDFIIYNPDLIGCGDCDMPSVAYYPIDWAEQLQYFLENVVKQPVLIIVQGASFPIAIKLVPKVANADLIRGLVLTTPPAWRTMTESAKPATQKLLWNLLFDSPLGLGQLFYLYARRRQFLKSFSERQLFADADKVNARWLDSLEEGAKDLKSRYAVFSFLAGFWREDYAADIAKIEQPTLIVWGKQTSSISKESYQESLKQRTDAYLKQLPQARVRTIEGRNVLPFESTSNFVEVVNEFWQQIQE